MILPILAGFMGLEQNSLIRMVSKMADCLFCRIAAGEIPTDLIYQDEKVVAFRDINPAAPVHLLIVPRQHIPDLRALEADQPELWAAMVHAVQHLAKEHGIAPEGFRIVINTGVKAGQSVFHLHLHLLGGREFGGF